MKVPLPRLHRLVVDLLVAVDVLPEHAETTASRLIEADLRGRSGHGVIRVPSYVTRIEAGGIDTRPAPVHAHQWMLHVGLTAPLDDVDGDPDLVAAARAALEDGVRELADGIRTSLNFFRTQDAAAPVERGVVTGPAVKIAGFVERLGAVVYSRQNVAMQINHRLVCAAAPSE